MKTATIAVFFLVSCLFFPTIVFAHGGKVHEQEMLAVFGISEQDIALTKRLHPTIEVFRKHIDHDYRDFYRGLKIVMYPHNFSWGEYGHRIFFHWGFNTDPRNSQSLQKQFNLATLDYIAKERGFQYIIYVGSRSNSKWNSFIERHNGTVPESLRLNLPSSVKGQVARNRDMLMAVQKLSFAQRKHHNAVATILYNTHIIGDYIEGKAHTQSAMQNLRDVVAGTIKHGIMNFDCPYHLKIQFKNEMWQAYYSSGVPKNKAKAILTVMTKLIPCCVENSIIIKRIVWGNMKPRKKNKGS